jgi:hypothetical protein
MVPSLMMAFVAIYFGVLQKNHGLASFMHDACVGGIKKSPFKGIKVSELREACYEEYIFNVGHETLWAGIRAGLQVFSLQSGG